MRFYFEKDLEGSQFMMKLEDNCLILILSKTILNTFLIVKVLSGKIYLDEGQLPKLFSHFLIQKQDLTQRYEEDQRFNYYSG